MKFAIKYPRKKFIEAENINDLKYELNKLMIEKLDIKNSTTKPFEKILSGITTKEITNYDFEIMMQENMVIIPTEIKQCSLG